MTGYRMPLCPSKPRKNFQAIELDRVGARASFPCVPFLLYDKKLRLEIYTYPASLFRRNEDMD